MKYKLQNIFKGNKSVYSVYSVGSYLNGEFHESSDIDLSLIVENPKAEDIMDLEERIAQLTNETGIKISTCYSEINELKKDISKLGMHSHGKKRSSFMYDILNSEKIYGKELKIDHIRYSPYEVYSNFSELITEIYKHINNPVKCVNLSLVAAKTTILLKEGRYPTKKKEIIKEFTEKIAKEKGEELNRSYKTKPDIQFLIDFCYFCKDYSRNYVKVGSYETIK